MRRHALCLLLTLCSAAQGEEVEFRPERADLLTAVWYADGRCQEFGLTRRSRGEGVTLQVPPGAYWGGFPLVRLTPSVAEELVASGATGLGLHDPRGEQLDLLATAPQLRVLHVRNARRLTDADLSRLVEAAPQLAQLHLEGAERITSLAPLRSLERLELLRVIHAPKLRGPGLAGLRGSPLRTLDLEGALLLGGDALELAAGLPRLERLGLDRCPQVDDETLGALAGLEGLRELGLLGTALSDAALPRLPPGLTALDLSDTAVTVAGLRGLAGRVAGLEELGLAACPALNAHTLEALPALTRLRRLDLRESAWARGLDLSPLGDLEHLAWLDLSGSPLSAGQVAQLASLPLRALRLNDCRLGPEVGEILGHCTQLRELALAGSGLDDEAVSKLGALESLEVLDLERSERFGDAGLRALAGLVRLRVLDLNRCSGLGDASVETLAGLSRLRLLDLYGCSLSKEALERLRQALPDCRVRAMQ